jgi:hypothetical protein
MIGFTENGGFRQRSRIHGGLEREVLSGSAHHYLCPTDGWLQGHDKLIEAHLEPVPKRVV